MCTVVQSVQWWWSWLRWGKPLAWRSITAQYITRTHRLRHLTPNIADTMAVEEAKTDNVTQEKKPELKEKKKNEEMKQFNFTQKPEVKHGWEGFLHFFWNPETGEFLGRTGMSWCKFIYTEYSKNNKTLENIFSEDYCLLYHLLLLPHSLLHADALCFLHHTEWHRAKLGHRQQRHHRQDPWGWLQTHASWW